MMKNNYRSFKNVLACVCVMILSVLILAGCGGKTSDTADTIKFEGDKYVSLAYPEDVFYYDYNGSSHDDFFDFSDPDSIYPIDSPNWDMIWNGGDLYCIKKHIDDANSYYADDSNYDWYVLIDSDEEDSELDSYPIEVTEEELDAIYGVEDKEKSTSAFFEEFEKFGSIFKISKDGVVCGTLSIAKYDGQWYWKSEIIDENKEKDGTWPEYIQDFPKSFDRKIKEAE